MRRHSVLQPLENTAQNRRMTLGGGKRTSTANGRRASTLVPAQQPRRQSVLPATKPPPTTPGRISTQPRMSAINGRRMSVKYDALEVLLKFQTKYADCPWYSSFEEQTVPDWNDLWVAWLFGKTRLQIRRPRATAQCRWPPENTSNLNCLTNLWVFDSSSHIWHELQIGPLGPGTPLSLFF